MREYGSETPPEALERPQSSPCFHATKSEAAFLTEPHCVAALKGLQERRAFVHVCVSVCTRYENHSKL